MTERLDDEELEFVRQSVEIGSAFWFVMEEIKERRAKDGALEELIAAAHAVAACSASRERTHWEGCEVAHPLCRLGSALSEARRARG